ncbi:hypothetical protein scyTo_0024543, partial [Scyliorhinus torazame]|nr:hypothetical protein [Scyliorhinus torazame]
MGDEYFANLDHIESVEKYKEGYESDAKCSSDSSGVDLKEEHENSGTEAEESSSDSSDQNFGNDDAYVPSSVWRSYVTRTKSREQKENGSEAGLARQASQEEPPAACKLPFTEETAKNKVASWLSALRVEDSTVDSDSRSSFKLAEGGGGDPKAPKDEAVKDEGGQPDVKRPPTKEELPPPRSEEGLKDEPKPAEVLLGTKPVGKQEGDKKDTKMEPAEKISVK